MKIPVRVAIAFLVLAGIASVPLLERERPTAAPAISSERTAAPASGAVLASTQPRCTPGFPQVPCRIVPPDKDAEILAWEKIAYDEETARVNAAIWQWQMEQKFYNDIAEAQAAAAAAASRSTGPAYHPGTTVGDCTGFAIPDYIIARESGGNSSAYNPSGAYGCAQTLLSHYSRGQCVGLDPYTIEGQRECVWRLSNGGTNLRPWDATR